MDLTTMSTGALVARMNRAADFAYDDEAVELNRRLAAEGKAWRWSSDFYHPVVEIYEQAEARG